MNINARWILAMMALFTSEARVLQSQQPQVPEWKEKNWIKDVTINGPPPYATNNTNNLTSHYTAPFYYFSKIKFLDASQAAQFLPIESYPLTNKTAAVLKTQTLAHSPMISADLPDFNATNLIWAIGGKPSVPGDSEFWNELKLVTEWQILRRNNASNPFVLPELMKDLNISEVAESVHNEYPGLWQSKLLQSLWGQGMKMDYSIMPFVSLVDFVGNTVRTAELNVWAIGQVCAPNFLVKWNCGRIRPEEAAYQLALNLNHQNVPEDLKGMIESMNLSSPEDFTAYPEGSPPHPSWPAMHSAASAASFWIAVVADLTEEQLCEAMRVDYEVAFARTIAGVHYPSDNIAGLNLGQHIMATKLPDHLAIAYGADATAAREKIRKLRFNWATFDPTTCSYEPLYSAVV